VSVRSAQATWSCARSREDRGRQGWLLGTLGAGPATDILHKGTQQQFAQAIEGEWLVEVSRVCEAQNVRRFAAPLMRGITVIYHPAT
jgi:hypothetical protein